MIVLAWFGGVAVGVSNTTWVAVHDDVPTALATVSTTGKRPGRW